MNHRVLLVDDEPKLLQSIQRTLRKEPFDIAFATSAPAALMHLKGHEVDVVVADHDMPGMKGLDLIKAIHERFPEVITFMLSGRISRLDTLELGERNPLFRFFSKPCDPFIIAAAIKDAVEKRGLTKVGRETEPL